MLSSYLLPNANSRVCVTENHSKPIAYTQWRNVREKRIKKKTNPCFAWQIEREIENKQMEIYTQQRETGREIEGIIKKKANKS